MKIVIPEKLVHSGKKRAYPSKFVWYCPDCNQWNIWQTKRLFGMSPVTCYKCLRNYSLDKNSTKNIIEDGSKLKSII